MNLGEPPAAIVARFQRLAIERVDRIDAGWTALIQGAGGDDQTAEIRRELHTLKGDARVLGQHQIPELCHKLEDLFEAAHERDYVVPDELDAVVTMTTRLLRTLIRKKEGATLGAIDLPGFLRQIDDAIVDLRARSVPPRPPSRAMAALALEAPDRVSTATQRRLAGAATALFLEALVAEDPASRARLCAVLSEIRALYDALSAVSLRAVLARHEPAAHELARALGKQVEVIFDPADVTVRPEAAEALDIATLHTLRNAVDHGIELPEVRRAAGKPLAGTIRISAAVSGDAVEVVIEDDGRGVAWEAVRARGVALGLLPAVLGAPITEEDLLDVLFRPGFSTLHRVSTVSGRGIGLDAVRAALRRAGGGGTVRLSSRPGRGTTFVLRVPQPSRVIDVQCFQASGVDLLLAIPSQQPLTLALEGGETAVDPLEALGHRATARSVHGGRRWVARAYVGGAAIAVLVGSAGRRVTAERFCPTADDRPAEIVRIDGRDALLLRLDRLARPAE